MVGAFLAFVLVVVTTVGITLWWIQRPIRPVVLSPPERAAVEAKVRYLEEPKPVEPALDRGATNRNSPEAEPGAQNIEGKDQPYVAGSKVLKLTEREVNGLLNANTDLGKSVRLQFDKDAVNAYVAVPIPQDFPVAGGKMFRARARMRVSLGNGGTPYAVLEDVTVFGLSLPKAWLGGLKGENLLADAVGERNGTPLFQGIKSLRVEPGALVLEVED